MSYTINALKQGVRKSYWSYTYTPTDAIIFLTYRCTSQCAACNIWQREVKIEDELTWEQWEPILENLARNNIRSIELFGGDALLRKELLIQMIRFCSENNIYTYFPTNSSSLTEKTVTQLVNAGLGTVYLSLDEVPEIGESVRGIKRHYERVIKSIRLFKEIRGDNKRPSVSCITTVSSMNYRHLDALIDVAREAGADEYEIRGISEFTTDAVKASAVDGIVPEPYFMPTDDKSHAFTAIQARDLLDNLQGISKKKSTYQPMSVNMTNMEGLKSVDLTKLNYPHQKCLFATTQVVISPYGEILPCLYYNDYHLGNIRDRDLSEIWGNAKHRIFCVQQQKKQIPLCNHCSIKYYHKPFIPVLKDVARKVVNRMGGE